MSSPCDVCNSNTSQPCPTCHAINYCSLKCRQGDWPVHKLLCNEFHSQSPRPNPSFARGILFPPESAAPQLVWVEIEKMIEEDDDVWYMPKIRVVLGSDNPHPEWKAVQRNAMKAFALNHTLQIVCRDAFLVDGSKPNRSLKEITNGKLGHDWRGPIVVLRQVGLEADPLYYEDVTLGDLRHAVDYFLWY